jgi:hypothetical protein
MPGPEFANDDLAAVRRELQRLNARVEGLAMASNLRSASIDNDEGATVVRLGRQADGSFGLVLLDADGDEVVRVGTDADGRYGILVSNNMGAPQVRLGQLQSGGFGLEAINPLGQAITLAALGFGIGAGFTDADETTTSTTYTDLATAGPVVPVHVPETGRLLIWASAFTKAPAGEASRMSFALTGANTTPATTGVAGIGDGSNVDTLSGYTSGARVLTGLTPGLTVVTAKYRSGSGGEVRFDNRTLLVFPL